MATEWPTIRLADSGTWLSGGTPSKSESDYWDGEIPWVTSKDLYVRYVDRAALGITPLGAANGTRLVEANTLLIVVRSMALANGIMVGLTRRAVAFNQDVKAIVPRAGIDPRFLLFSLWGHEREIRGLIDEASHGTKRLSTEVLGDLAIPLPPLDEQRRIASVLGALDDKIDSNRRLADAALAVVAAEYRHRFSREADTRPLSAYASSWKQPIQPSATPDEAFEHFSIPAFDAGALPDITTGASMLSGKTHLPDEQVVLFSKLNPATKRVWWPSPLGAGTPVCSPEFLTLVPTGDDVPPSFLFAVCAFDERFFSEVLGYATGTTGSRQRVKPLDVLACPVPAAGSTDLADWGRFARPLLDLAISARNESRTLAVVRDALLPKLVSGQIRVPPDDDVSVEDLAA